MAGTLAAAVVVVVVVIVALANANAQHSDSPVVANAHADDHQPINDRVDRSVKGDVDLNVVDKELFKRLFIMRRKEQLESVKHIQKIDNYNRQYKMINLLVEKMFEVIETKKVLFDNFTETELKNISFPTGIAAKNDIKDAFSNVLENIAFFGDLVLNMPDITHRILKTQPKWKSTIRWSFDFLNQTKNWLDKSTLEMINLASQELNVTKRDPNYFNPNSIVNLKTHNKVESTKAHSSKKEKRIRGPRMTKIEL